MCQKYPGPRCTPHVRARLDSARRRFDAAQALFDANPADIRNRQRLDTAKTNSTPDPPNTTQPPVDKRYQCSPRPNTSVKAESHDSETSKTPQHRRFSVMLRELPGRPEALSISQGRERRILFLWSAWKEYQQ